MYSIKIVVMVWLSYPLTHPVLLNLTDVHNKYPIRDNRNRIACEQINCIITVDSAMRINHVECGLFNALSATSAKA